MTPLIVVVFLLHEVFFGLLSLYYANAMRAQPFELSQLEVKLWREDTPLAAGATTLLLAVRVAGIAWLIRLGVRTEWFYPLVLYVGALLATVVINGVVRAWLGLARPALASFFALPVLVFLMWFVV